MPSSLVSFISDIDQLFSSIGEVLDASSKVTNSEYAKVASQLTAVFLYHQGLWRQAISTGDGKKVIVCGQTAAHEMINRLAVLTLFCYHRNQIEMDQDSQTSCITVTNVINNIDKLLYKLMLSMRGVNEENKDVAND